MAWFRRGKKSEESVEDVPATADVEQADVETMPTIGVDRGPWDSASVDGDEGYLKLGALWIPAIEGLMLTFEMDQSQSEVTAVQVVRGDSTIQLQAFAAPRSVGLWDEIRAEIAEAQGTAASEEEGEFGPELVVRAGGGVMRFIGIDGPRWFLRGVVTGRAAVDHAASAPMRELLAHVVVDRGGEPMGPRELLTLTLPAEGQPEVEGDETGRSADDLDPFTRGPEITEIR